METDLLLQFWPMSQLSSISSPSYSGQLSNFFTAWIMPIPLIDDRSRSIDHVVNPCCHTMSHLFQENNMATINLLVLNAGNEGIFGNDPLANYQ